MTDTNLNFRHFCDDLYLPKNKLAICLASAFIESLNLNELTPEKKVLKLTEELDLLKQKIDDFEFNEYLIFADDEHQLYNIFSAYLLFYHRDDQAILGESLILNEKYKQLSQLLPETKAQLPIFPLNVSICCLSWINCNRSLTDILEEKIGLHDPLDHSYKQLFEQIFEQGIFQSKKRITEFKSKYPSNGISDHKYQFIISYELTKLSVDWNNLANPDYYQFLLVNENVKSYFLTNCLLNIYIEKHKIELIKTVVINEMVNYFENELSQINKKLIRTLSDLNLLIHQISKIISVMVPDHNLINKLKNAFALTSKSLKARKPILFIVLHLEDSFPSIFNQALMNLQQLLETLPADKKVTYAIRQIIDLEYMELIESRNKHNLNPFIADLKKTIKTELDCVQFRQNYKPVKKDHHLTETETQDTKKFSFGYKKATGYLSPFIPRLNMEINFLDSRTTQESFERIITAANLDTINEKIYLGCQTNEFTYLIKYFKTAFKSFNPATIGKSGLFISNTGHTITADSIYNSKIDNLQTKFAIDNIFNKK